MANLDGRKGNRRFKIGPFDSVVFTGNFISIMRNYIPKKYFKKLRL